MPLPKATLMFFADKALGFVNSCIDKDKEMKCKKGLITLKGLPI